MGVSAHVTYPASKLVYIGDIPANKLVYIGLSSFSGYGYTPVSYIL